MLALALGVAVSMVSGELPAEAPSPGPGAPEPASLELQLERLEAARPSLTCPIALTATGGGLLLGGALLMLGGGLAWTRSGGLSCVAALPSSISGLASALLGLLVGIVAGERLVDALDRRQRLDVELERLRRQLDSARPPHPGAPLRSAGPAAAAPTLWTTPADAPTLAALGPG